MELNLALIDSMAVSLFCKDARKFICRHIRGRTNSEILGRVEYRLRRRGSGLGRFYAMRVGYTPLYLQACLRVYAEL